MIKKVKIPSSKGNLAAVIHYPKQETEKLAILCSGYLDSKNYEHLVELAKNLNEEGYTAVRFDPTGTWESEGDISEYSLTQYLEDVKNVLEYMLGKSNYKQVLVGGHSRGGKISVLYAARDPRVTLVLGIMPSAGPMKGQRRKKWEKAGVSVSKRDFPGDRNKKKEFSVPFSHVLDLDQYDAIRDAKNIKVPIVLIAGELDKLISPSEVKEIFDNANEPKKFLIIPKIGHDYRFNDDEIAVVNKKILEQLNSIKSS